MIPAKIIEISDKVLVEYVFEYHPEINNQNEYAIAEVENVMYRGLFNYWFVTAYWGEVDYKQRLELNQQVFIEPTTEGKCKIIKLNQ